MNVYSKSFLNKMDRDIKDCDLISTVSPSNSEVLKKLFKKKTFILTNVVEEFFTFRYLNLNPRFQFICVANLIPMKNVISIVEAFNIISKSYDAGLTLVGKGPLKNQINDLILNYDIQSKVDLIEHLPPKELSKRLSASNCLILNSDYETFGVAVIEGLACGLPVIVSDKVGSNFFINSSNGLIIEHRNTNQLIESMKRMIINYNNYDRKKISEESKNRFGKKAFINNVKTLYDLKWRKES
jgi:glycosyltransferase involved in cell wall biosynthesis